MEDRAASSRAGGFAAAKLAEGGAMQAASRVATWQRRMAPR